MPFFIGILSSSLSGEYLRSLRPPAYSRTPRRPPDLKKVANSMEDEVIIVDLDQDKFLSKKTTDDLGLLPTSATAPLLTIIERTAKWTKGQSSFRRRLRSGSMRLQGQSLLREKLAAFTHLQTELMLHYQGFLTIEESSGKRAFDTKSFLESRPAELRPVHLPFVDP